MTNKNPFQIRSEVLELAKDYMDKQVQMNIEFAEKMKTIGKFQAEEYAKAYQPYTFEQLMEKAREMYIFVSTKDK